MSWEPREENISKFEELDSKISFHENELQRYGIPRQTMSADTLRMSARFQALSDMLCDDNIVDRDTLNLTAMEIELEALHRILEEAKKQQARARLIVPKPGGMNIPKGGL